MLTLTRVPGTAFKARVSPCIEIFQALCILFIAVVEAELLLNLILEDSAVAELLLCLTLEDSAAVELLLCLTLEDCAAAELLLSLILEDRATVELEDNAIVELEDNGTGELCGTFAYTISPLVNVSWNILNCCFPFLSSLSISIRV